MANLTVSVDSDSRNKSSSLIFGSEKVRKNFPAFHSFQSSSYNLGVPERLYFVPKMAKPPGRLKPKKILRLFDNLPHDVFWMEGFWEEDLDYEGVSLKGEFGVLIDTTKEALEIHYFGTEGGLRPYWFGREKTALKSVIDDFSETVATASRGEPVVFIAHYCGPHYVGSLGPSDALNDDLRGHSLFAASIAALMLYGLFSALPTHTYAKSPLAASRAVYSPYLGDSVVVRQVWERAGEYALATPLKRAEILARKREHAVRGHLRTYKSGLQVWVTPHRRGDKAIGTVTSHHVLKRRPA